MFTYTVSNLFIESIIPLDVFTYVSSEQLKQQRRIHNSRYIIIDDNDEELLSFYFNINKTEYTDNDIIKQINYFLLKDTCSRLRNLMMGYLILNSLTNEFDQLGWSCGWDIKNITEDMKDIYIHLFSIIK